MFTTQDGGVEEIGDGLSEPRLLLPFAPASGDLNSYGVGRLSQGYVEGDAVSTLRVADGWLKTVCDTDASKAFSEGILKIGGESTFDARVAAFSELTTVFASFVPLGVGLLVAAAATGFCVERS
jgi:hypothetical protein